jgi:hypothetical protein
MAQAKRKSGRFKSLRRVVAPGHAGAHPPRRWLARRQVEKPSLPRRATFIARQPCDEAAFRKAFHDIRGILSDDPGNGLTRHGSNYKSAPMSKWALRTSQYLLIGTLLVSMGGHLALLQTIAWGNMLVDYSSKGSLTEAVGKTFDGEHPCHLCKVVKKSKSEEKKKPLLKSEMKWEVAMPAPVKVPFPQSVELAFRVTEYSGNYREVHLALPMQPPRAV